MFSCSNEVPRPDITLPPHGCGHAKCPSGHGQYPTVRSGAQGAAHCRAAGVWEPFSSSSRVCVYGRSTWGAALESGERVIIEDVTDHAIFAGTPVLEVMLDAGARAVQATRLVGRSGCIVCMISTHHRRPGGPTSRSCSLLRCWRGRPWSLLSASVFSPAWCSRRTVMPEGFPGGA